MKLVRGYECSKLLHFGLREFTKLFTLLQNQWLLQFIGNMYNSEKTSDNSITWKDVDRIKIWEWSYHCQLLTECMVIETE